MIQSSHTIIWLCAKFEPDSGVIKKPSCKAGLWMPLTSPQQRAVSLEPWRQEVAGWAAGEHCPVTVFRSSQNRELKRHQVWNNKEPQNGAERTTTLELSRRGNLGSLSEYNAEWEVPRLAKQSSHKEAENVNKPQRKEQQHEMVTKNSHRSRRACRRE